MRRLLTVHEALANSLRQLSVLQNAWGGVHVLVHQLYYLPAVESLRSNGVHGLLLTVGMQRFCTSLHNFW